MAKKKKPTLTEGVTVGVWLPRGDYEKLQIAAAKEDRSVSAYLRLAVRDRMEREAAR